MDKEQLLAEAQEADEFETRRSDVLRANRENRQIFHDVGEEVRNFVLSTGTIRPNHSFHTTPPVVLEKDVEFPQLGRGYIIVKIQPPEDEATRTLEAQDAFVFNYYFVPTLAVAGSGQDKLVACEFFTDNRSTYAAAPRLPRTLRGLEKADRYDLEELEKCEQDLVDNKPKLDSMVGAIQSSLQLITKAAMDPELNPQLAKTVQDYYLELSPREEAVTIAG